MRLIETVKRSLSVSVLSMLSTASNRSLLTGFCDGGDGVDEAVDGRGDVCIGSMPTGSASMLKRSLWLLLCSCGWADLDC